MIAVERTVAVPPERVFDFFADLRNHWRLERRKSARPGEDDE